jgi:transposase
VQVAIGIDTHKGSLAAAAVDALGRVLDVREFTNDPTGHRSLLRWVKEQAQPRTIGIEGSLSYGSAAARMLLGHAEDVREVAALLTHQERCRRAKGRSDPVDAVAIARVVAADETLPSARRTTLLTDLKLLVDYRDQLVHARTQVANRVHADLVIIRPGYEQVVPNLRAKRHVAKARSLLGRDRSVQAELVRRRLGEILRLEAESPRPTGGSPTSSLKPIPPSRRSPASDRSSRPRSWERWARSPGSAPRPPSPCSPGPRRSSRRRVRPIGTG